jgi:hypothetical protein
MELQSTYPNIRVKYDEDMMQWDCRRRGYNEGDMRQWDLRHRVYVDRSDTIKLQDALLEDTMFVGLEMHRGLHDIWSHVADMVMLCALTGVGQMKIMPTSIARYLSISEYKRLCVLLPQYWREYGLDIPPALCVGNYEETNMKPLFPFMASHPNDVVTFELQKWLPLPVSMLELIMGYMRITLPLPDAKVMLHSLQTPVHGLVYVAPKNWCPLKINLIDHIKLIGSPATYDRYYDALYGGIRGPRITVGIIQGVGEEIFEQASWWGFSDIYEVIGLKASSSGYTYEPLANFAAKSINSAMVSIHMHGNAYWIQGMPLMGDLTQSGVTWYALWVMATAFGGNGTWGQLVSACTVGQKRLYRAPDYSSMLQMSFGMQVRIRIPPIGYISINGVRHRLQDLIDAFEEQDYTSADLPFMDPTMAVHTVFEIFVFMKIINDVNDIITRRTVHVDDGHDWRHQKDRFVRTPTSFQMPLSFFDPSDRGTQARTGTTGPRSPHGSRPGASGTTIMTPLQAEQALASVLLHLTATTSFVRARERDMPIASTNPKSVCEHYYIQFPFAHASPPNKLQEGFAMVGVVDFKMGLIRSIPGRLSKTTPAVDSPIWFGIGAGIEQHQPLELLHTVTNPVVTDLLSQIRGWCPGTEKWSDFDIFGSMSNLVSQAWWDMEMPKMTRHDLDIMESLLHTGNESLFFSRFCPEESSLSIDDLPYSKAMLAFALENMSFNQLYNAENYYYPGCSPMFAAPQALSLQAEGYPQLGDTRFLYTAGVSYNHLDINRIITLLNIRSCPRSLPTVPELFPGLAGAWPTVACMHEHTKGDIILPRISRHFLFAQVVIWLWLKGCSCRKCTSRIASSDHCFRASNVTMLWSQVFAASFSPSATMESVVDIPDLSMLLALCADEEHRSKLEAILSSVYLTIQHNASGVSRLAVHVTPSEILGVVTESSDATDRNTHYAGPGFLITFRQ